MASVVMAYGKKLLLWLQLSSILLRLEHLCAGLLGSWQCAGRQERPLSLSTYPGRATAHRCCPALLLLTLCLHQLTCKLALSSSIPCNGCHHYP